MLRLLMLEAIFELTVWSWFPETSWCHCHLQCQICFGLGYSRDAEGFWNIGVSLGCSYYFCTKVCSQMMEQVNWLVIQIYELVPAWYSFYREVVSRLWYIISAGVESIPQSCFSIRGGDASVPAPFHTWSVEGFCSVIWCAESLQDSGVFFILVQMRLRDIKKIP